MNNKNEDSLLIKKITSINENIKVDKDRLTTLLSILNSGKDDDKINSVLIKALSDIEYDDTVITSALEYIILLFTNAQTQKINRSKEITEELVKILKHNLDLLDSIEGCIVVFNTDINTHLKNTIEEHIKENTVKEKDVTTDDTDDTDGKPMYKKILSSILHSLLPNNTVSNMLVWGIIFMFAVIVAFKIDNDAMEHTDAVVKSTKEIINTTKQTPLQGITK